LIFRAFAVAASLCSLGLAALTLPATAQTPRADQLAFRAIYEEMVEIDSSPATGSCTRVVAAAAKRLTDAGYPAADVQLVIPTGAPEDGNLVATLRGTNARSPAILLLAHIDVVNANRADWERDPFTLVEENGFFYGRGAIDDKAMAAVFLDMMIRMKAENFRPRRTLKLALTCGEETSNRVNGVDYLLKNHRDLLQAGFAINEGAGGSLAPDGKPIALEIQSGEKIHQVMTFTVANPGGHSSRPRRDNAITQLSAALQRLDAHRFPVELNPVTRTFFERMAPLTGGEMGAAMTALARNPADTAASDKLATDATYNAMMRTTCTVTQVEGGHAANALPQSAKATLSCRVLQGHTPEEVKAELERVVADPGVKVDVVRRREGSQAPQLTRAIMAPVERVAARMWPGTPIIPIMLPGATDGRFLNTAGIPTYGLSGLFAVPGETNPHGLNEKIRVKSLYEGRDFLDAVVRDYARQR
jgi:acetylornithine deacetylase/succinyl-diaminopimelate desuccinylase-like protein